MIVGDRVLVVDGPWKGHAGTVLPRPPGRDRNRLLRLDNGTESLCPEKWLRPASLSDVKEETDADA